MHTSTSTNKGRNPFRTQSCSLRTAALCALIASQMIFAQGQPLVGEEFKNIRLLAKNGDKSKEEEVMLRLEADRLIVQSRQGSQALKEFPYATIKAADYSYSKHPRWRSGIALAVAFGVFAAPVFFMKGKKHWFTVRTENDSAVLHLDKGNYETVLREYEVRSGLKVDRIMEEKKKKG